MLCLSKYLSMNSQVRNKTRWNNSPSFSAPQRSAAPTPSSQAPPPWPPSPHPASLSPWQTSCRYPPPQPHTSPPGGGGAQGGAGKTQGGESWELILKLLFCQEEERLATCLWPGVPHEVSWHHSWTMIERWVGRMVLTHRSGWDGHPWHTQVASHI